MLNIVKNGIFASAPIFEEDKRLEEQRDKFQIVDFDLSPSKDELAILFKNSVIYLYSFKESRKIVS